MNSVELYTVYRQRDSWQVVNRQVHRQLINCTLQHGKCDQYFGFIVVHYGYLGKDTFLKCIINGFIGVNAGK